MNHDFSKMTGYEFEDYVAQLFRTMGFRVTQTDYSGDGGIDMLLFYDKPVFKGKYVVQCKNYTGLVGQPEIRDLYGVVMSESANKGILITTSDFTEQAYEFADGKNLELINRTVLNQMIANNASDDHEIDDSKHTIFTECDGFNTNRYAYLKRKINDQPSEAKNYNEMISFLREYVVNGDIAICQAGLFEELFSYIHLYKDRCYKAKSKVLGKTLCNSLEAEMRIAVGDLAEATRIIYEIGPDYYYRYCKDIDIYLNYGQHKEAYERNKDKYGLAIGGNIDRVKVNGYSMLSHNLYSAYRQLGYTRGIKSILKYFKRYDDIEEYIQVVFEKRHSYPIASYSETFEVYQRFLNGEYDNLFYFIQQSISNKKNIRGGDYYIVRTIDGLQNTSFLRKNYYIKADAQIVSELDKMFDSLGL